MHFPNFDGLSILKGGTEKPTYGYERFTDTLAGLHCLAFVMLKNVVQILSSSA
ncbi:hypothetical protein BH10CHL1_BH10CHL1_30370 [soil metagenome]